MATRSPKAARNCEATWGVSAISGTRISTCRPLRDRVARQAHVELGLAAAGDAVHQRGMKGAAVEQTRQRRQRRRLLVGQRTRLVAIDNRRGTSGKRIALAHFLVQVHEATAPRAAAACQGRRRAREARRRAAAGQWLRAPRGRPAGGRPSVASGATLCAAARLAPAGVSVAMSAVRKALARPVIAVTRSMRPSRSSDATPVSARAHAAPSGLWPGGRARCIRGVPSSAP